jgi:hypothetical protein
MNTKHILIYSLVSFCSTLLFISSARAQPCTPVVYAFRHAEDFKRNLTLVGRQHANLYPAMVASSQLANNYCAVGFVYSMYYKNPNGSLGTNNPFETAEPLANVACYNLAFYTNSNPASTCGGSGSEPRTAGVNGGKMYEFLGAKTSEQTSKEGVPPNAGKSATGPELLDGLIKTMHVGGGLSSAIFWTSEGLNVLGQAIVPGFTGIPGCSVPPPDDTKCPADKGTAPRNAAYVFVFNGSGFDPPDITQYVQCFNVRITKFSTPPTLEGPPTVTTGGETTYWCGNGGRGTGNLPATSSLESLDATFKGLDLLQGKICDTSSLPGRDPNYYGFCQ